MSFRREPTNLDERVAEIEATLRRLGSRVVVDLSSGSIAALAEARGDLFVAVAANAVDRLGVGADGSVLKADSSSALGVGWQTDSGADAAMLAWLNA